MLPRIVRLMLMGREPRELKRRRHPARAEPAWQLEEGATHPSQGHFAVDDGVNPTTPAVTIEPVDAGAAEAMAAEARRLAVPKS